MCCGEKSHRCLSPLIALDHRARQGIQLVAWSKMVTWCDGGCDAARGVAS